MKKLITTIEVKDFTIVSPPSEVEKAKKLLKDKGYFVGNLWHIKDVQSRFNCTDEEAQLVLENALHNEGAMEQIWMSIDFAAEKYNLKRKTE